MRTQKTIVVIFSTWVAFHGNHTFTVIDVSLTYQKQVYDYVDYKYHTIYFYVRL